MWKLIAIGFSVHWVREVFTMRCLIHGWSLSTLNAATLTWIFVWAAMIYSIILLCHVWMMRWWSAKMIVVIIHTTILNWVWCIHAVHDVGEIAWSIYCLANVWTVVHRWVCYWLTCRVLYRWMTWVWLSRRWWSWLDVLREVASTWLTLSCTWSMIRSTHVILFTTLWANSSKPSKSWWTFVMIIIVICCLSNRTSILCYLIVWI